MERGLQSTSATDQASRLRQWVHSREKTALTLAVTSGKGGVGKSNVAVNLSICLAARKLRVTLVDVDMGLANVDLLMNLQPRYTISHVMSGLRTLEEVMIEGPAGLRVIPGANGVRECADISDFERQNLVHQIQRLETNADIVVLDCGAGISRNVLTFAVSANQVLVVTTPQPTALADAYATIKTLHRERYNGKVSVFVNMARSKSEATAAYTRLTKVAERFLKFPVAYLGYMLHDTAVELAVRQRSPFVVRYPGSNASACITAVSAELARLCVVRENRGGWFKRVVGLFA